MAYEEDCPSLPGDVMHFAQALPLEPHITDGEDFVYDENIGFEVGCDRKGEARIHAGGVAFDGGVEKFFNLGKIDDVVKEILDLS